MGNEIEVKGMLWTPQDINKAYSKYVAKYARTNKDRNNYGISSQVMKYK